jgi:hypothetical protein
MEQHSDYENDNASEYSLDYYSESNDSDEDEFNLPCELDYIRRMPALDDYLDLDKLYYNDSFKRKGVNHIVQKMPAGNGDHIPGWHKVLQKMAENISESPLDEMIKLSVDNIYDRKDTIVSQQQNSE